MESLKNKVAIVTGAGRGIGRGIALRYGAAGLKVVVASRTTSTVEAVVGEIKADGGTAVGITCDVGDQDQIKSMVNQTIGCRKTTWKLPKAAAAKRRAINPSMPAFQDRQTAVAPIQTNAPTARKPP